MKAIKIRDTKNLPIVEIAGELEQAWYEFVGRIDESVVKGKAQGRDPDKIAKIWADDVWYPLMWFGEALVDRIIKEKAIPAGSAKKLELAARSFNEIKRFPTKATSWVKRNEAGFNTLMDGAMRWPEKTGLEGPLQVGGFTVTDSVGLDDKKLQTTTKNIQEIQNLVKRSGIPKAGEILYGDLMLVGKIRGNSAAWYKHSEDVVYLRPLIRKVTDRQRHDIAHELGHRYWDKVMSAEMQKAWKRHHSDLEFERPGEITLEPGVVFRNVHVTGIKGDPVIDRVDDNYVYLKGPKEPKLKKMQAWKVLYDQAQKQSFPSDYAATAPDEHFCEAFSMYVNSNLPEKHKQAFDEIVTGKASKQAGVIKYPPKTAKAIFLWARDVLAQYVWQQALLDTTNSPHTAGLIRYCEKLVKAPGRPSTTSRVYLDMSGWKFRDQLEAYRNYSLKVLLLLRDCPGHVGQWDERIDLLEVCTGPIDRINSVDTFRRLLFDVRRTIQHELEHTVQSLLKKALWLSERGGLPSKRIRDESGGRDAPHPLRDIEFYPNLADALDTFSLKIRNIPEKARKLALYYWFGEISKHDLRDRLATEIKDDKERFDTESEILFDVGRITTPFHQLRKHQKAKWKKAVKVFVAEIQRRGFRLGTMRTAGWWRIKGPDSPGGLDIKPLVDKGDLLNAIPGIDPGDLALYNGDGPADVMDEALAKIDLLYRAAWGRRVDHAEAQAVFNFCSSLLKPDPKNTATSYIVNKWIEEIAKIADVDMQKIAQLPQDAIDALKGAWREYQNSAIQIGVWYSKDNPSPEPTLKARLDFLWTIQNILDSVQHLLTRTARTIRIDKGLVSRVVEVMHKKILQKLKGYPQDKPLGDRDHDMIDRLPVPVKLPSGETVYASTTIKAQRGKAHWMVRSHQIVPGGRAMQFADPSAPLTITGREIEVYLNGNYTPAEIMEKYVGKGTEEWSLKYNLRRVLLHEMTHIADPGSLKPVKGPYLDTPTEVRARAQEIADQVLTHAYREAERMEGYTTIQSMVEHGLENSTVWDAVRKQLSLRSKKYILKAVYQTVAEQEYDLITKWKED